MSTQSGHAVCRAHSIHIGEEFSPVFWIGGNPASWEIWLATDL